MLVREARLVGAVSDERLCWTYMQKKGETREERARARTEK